MSVVTSLVLVYHSLDERIVDNLVLDPEHTEDQRFIDVTETANEAAYGPSRKMLQLRLAATAVNYFNVEQLTERIATLPWKEPESVMLLVQKEDEVRPAVWGFKGVRCYQSIEEPRQFVELLPAVPS